MQASKSTYMWGHQGIMAIMKREAYRDISPWKLVTKQFGCGTGLLRATSITRLLVFCLLIGNCLTVTRGQEVAFPKLQKDRVYVLKQGLNIPAYKTLENQSLELEKGTPQSYYTVILDSAGPGRYAIRDYADSLFQYWSQQPGFDSARSVVIAVALGDTPPRVALHPGRELQALGLRPSVIQRELIEQPTTIELARNKRFPDAVASLIRTTQSWIAEAESGRTRSQNAEREFSAQVRKGASEAIATADRLLGETTQELEQKRSAGLGVQGIEGRINQALTQLNTLRGKVDTDPRSVLARATEVQHSLEQELARLRGLAGLQNQATARLESLSTQFGQVEEALETARKNKLATDPLQTELEKVTAKWNDAKKAIARDPEVALAQASDLESQLKSIQQHILTLPQLHKQRLTLASEIIALRNKVSSELELGRKAGASVEAVRARFSQDSQAIEDAAGTEVKDEEKALATLTNIEGRLREQFKQAKQTREQYQFLSRTLPLGLGAGLVSLVGILVGGLWYIRRRKHTDVDRRYREFRAKATEGMETLDRLKERHRMLTATDPDFTEPIRGKTLTVYMNAQEQINKLRDRWLESMDNLEKARILIANASSLSTEQLQKAEDILQDEKPFEEIQELLPSITGMLDQLGTAHEDAKAKLKVLEEGLAALGQRLGGLESHGLPAGPYQTEREAVGQLIEKAKTELVVDPLTAQELFQKAQDRLDALRQRSDDVAQRSEQGRSILSRLDETRGVVVTRRSKGLKLDEPGGNPDDLLEEARESHGQGIEALRKADPQAAGPALDQASARIDQAGQLVERVDTTREVISKTLPIRRTEIETLQTEITTAAQERAKLERDFATDSWKEVAGNLEKAQSRLEESSRLLESAKALGSDGKQHYLESQRVLEKSALAQQDAQTLRSSIHQRLEYLNGIRTECQGVWPDLVEQSQEISRYVDSHAGVVSSQAKANLGRALRLQQEVEQLSTRPQANWIDIQQKLAEVREGLAIANESAKADVKAQEDVVRKLAQLRPRIAQIGNLLRSENKDRPPSNLRYKSASDAFDRIERELASGTGDWQLLNKRLDDAATELSQSETLARSDIELANQALSEIDAARRSVRTTQGYSALGVSADARMAKAQLDQAERALQAQDYEHAIQLAAAAEQAARTAYNEASRQAAYRQQQIEAERRRQAAARMAAQTGRLPTPGGLPPSMWEIGVGSAVGSIFGNMISGGGGSFGSGIDLGGGGQGSWGGDSGGGDSGGQGSW